MRVLKYFSWNPEKNENLVVERGVSVEEVAFHIERGDLLDVLERPNQERYPGPRIFIANIRAYEHPVPFIENEREMFLKTIIPNRKATDRYLRRGESNG